MPKTNVYKPQVIVITGESSGSTHSAGAGASLGQLHKRDLLLGGKCYGNLRSDIMCSSFIVLGVTWHVDGEIRGDYIN